MKTKLWGRYGQKVKFYGQWELAYNGVLIGKILKENTKILLII